MASNDRAPESGRGGDAARLSQSPQAIRRSRQGFDLHNGRSRDVRALAGRARRRQAPTDQRGRALTAPSLVASPKTRGNRPQVELVTHGRAFTLDARAQISREPVCRQPAIGEPVSPTERSSAWRSIPRAWDTREAGG
jgi:hypothetical protein